MNDRINLLRLTKRVEYGIIAAQYMAANPGKRVSAKKLALATELSFDFLSKTLQCLLKSGVMTSQKGVKGGYTLARLPNEISLADIIYSLEENTSLTVCMSDESVRCEKEKTCTLKNPLHILQTKIDDLLASTFVSEIIDSNYINNPNIKIDLNKVKNG